MFACDHDELDLQIAASCDIKDIYSPHKYQLVLIRENLLILTQELDFEKKYYITCLHAL